MIAPARELHEAHVALQNHGLRGVRRAGKPEPCGEFAFVDHAFADKMRVFGVVHDQRFEIARIGQRAAHHHRVHQALCAVGESDRAGCFQQTDLGHLLAA